MGEAKRRVVAQREAFRVHLLREADKWSCEPTDAEAAIVQAIVDLPVMEARRMPAGKLKLLGMPPKQCHANCLWYSDGEPDRRVRLGWLRDDDGVYVLHSVIEQDGALMCITPSMMGAPDVFEFIPDDDVKMVRVGGGHWKFQRDGIEIGHGVRAQPSTMIEKMQTLRTALLAGVEPTLALEQIGVCRRNDPEDGT